MKNRYYRFDYSLLIYYRMEKFKINVSALETGKADLILGKEPRIVKLSFEQAMGFRCHFSSFEEMLEAYGAKNRLPLDEYYDGYVAVYYSSYRQEVVHVNGMLRRCMYSGAMLMWAPYEIKEAATKGGLYEVLYPLDNGEFISGLFNYVWTFNDCEFERLAAYLQKEKLLSEDINPKEIDVSLKRKLTQSLVDKKPLIVDYDECELLYTYLLDYFSSFFTRKED